MQRGFKTAAKKLSLELREEIGLKAMDPFDPYQMAELYGIQVHRLSELECSDEARNHFMEANPKALSGALIPIGTKLAILDHDGHSVARRRATLSHEISHVVLEHHFSNSALLDSTGCRTSDPEQEEQAVELSGELLVPFSAALLMARQGNDDATVSLKMGVSVEFARWRMNASGARKIASRGRK
jgi:hypothetical protein